jgi:tellurite resistance protein TerC
VDLLEDADIKSGLLQRLAPRARPPPLAGTALPSGELPEAPKRTLLAPTLDQIAPTMAHHGQTGFHAVHGPRSYCHHRRWLFSAGTSVPQNSPMETLLGLPFPSLASVTVGFDRWAEFIGLIIFLLLLDLFVVHRKAEKVSLKSAAGWSVFWIGLAVAFGGWVWWEYGDVVASQYFSAYITEKALSVDNLFVFVTIFSFFRVPEEHRHKVLFLGILGALVMRGLFIWLGIEMLQRWTWMFPVFGLILLVTAYKMVAGGESDGDLEKKPIYRLSRKLIPMVPEYDGGKFTVVREGRRYGTPLLIVLVMIELTDLVFAIDSVPAVLGISQDLFIVYTSNVMAILGLRALFFLVGGAMEEVPGLKAGLALVLAYVGLKMMAHPLHIKIPEILSFFILVGLLVGSWAIATILRNRERRRGG